MEDMLQKLKNTVLEFNMDGAESTARAALAAGVDPVDAANALTEGIQIVGQKFGTGEFCLPDLVCAAEVLKQAFPPINAEFKKSKKAKESQGKVVIGTVYGDIHNIGKDMVATLLYAAGFDVIDLGTNVKADDFLSAVKENDPDIVAMSALLTTTAAEQKSVIDGLEKAGLREKVRVIVGGSPINQEFADSIGADGYGATAPEGVRIAQRFMGKK